MYLIIFFIWQENPIEIEEKLSSIQQQCTNGYFNQNSDSTRFEDSSTSSTVITLGYDDNDINNNLNDRGIKQDVYRYQKVYHNGTEKTGNFAHTFLTDKITGTNRNFNLISDHFGYKQKDHRHVCDMGSNVSRNTNKQLSEWRSQSSGEFQCSRMVQIKCHITTCYKISKRSISKKSEDTFDHMANRFAKRKRNS